MGTEASSGVLLLVATVTALVWANTPWAQSYFDLWRTPVSLHAGGVGIELSLLHWVNDGLMAVFFFLVGLEIKREVLLGELSSPRKAALPIAAAFGGMVVPALIYVAFKLNFRALRLYETVDLTQDALTVTRVAPTGKSQSWSFNPYWVRLNLEPRLGRSSELSLASHGKRLVFASFLSDAEREDLASALRAALASARSSGAAQ